MEAVSYIITIIMCFVALAGWLSGRDKKITDDSEWKGVINTKLDGIQSGVSGINKEMAEMKGTISNLENRVIILETRESVKGKIV
ncbi:MAG: hypothetical protein E7L17_13180 [Clostridium sp.]|uniref:hypothetical protein n=1 Tax=Clostridium sp. TaxID=1506 RepID=UPI002912F7A0|nr:hypothetical protein [Clostridium sp.]MDU7339055.1 hypothetical protein [Clostridium sp.]